MRSPLIYWRALNRVLKIAVLVILAGIIVSGSLADAYLSTRSSLVRSSSSVTEVTSSRTAIATGSSSAGSTISSPNPNRLIDLVADGVPGVGSLPDGFDPAYGFLTYDAPVMTNVYQELVTFDGNNTGSNVGVLADSWNVSSNSMTYNYTMRPHTWFSNGDPVSSYDAWFSFVREIYLNARSGVAPTNYNGLTMNFSANTADAEIPWGLSSAVASLGGAYANANGTSQADVNLLVSFLNNMLSNFDPSNSTQLAVMGYPNQAYVCPNNSTFVANLLSPYSSFNQVISSWWGAVIDPSSVDANGGVANNTVDPYINNNGAIGSGPYSISGLNSTNLSVSLEASSNYWAASDQSANLPGILQPPHIAQVDAQYNATASARIQDFASNTAQISYVEQTSIGQMYSSYRSANPLVSFNQIFLNVGYAQSIYYVALNTQRFPANIPDFRLAIAHAVNNTQQLNSIFTNPVNGEAMAESYLGPMTQQSGPLYDPSGLPPYAANYSLADEEISLAGVQGNFSVLLANGTAVGCVTCSVLPTIPLVYLLPSGTLADSQLQMVKQDLANIGVNVTLSGENSTFYSSSATSPSTTPVLTYQSWFPDWPDPVYELLMQAATSCCGLPGWLNNASINQIMATLPHENSSSANYTNDISQVYLDIYQKAPYVWLPNPEIYFFVQPYLRGFEWNPFDGYYYNTMYYA